MQLSNSQDKASILEWMSERKTTMIKKNQRKEPSSVILLNDSIFTNDMENPDHIDKRKNYSLVYRRLFPEEQKGWYKGTRGTSELLYVDQHIKVEKCNHDMG